MDRLVRPALFVLLYFTSFAMTAQVMSFPHGKSEFQEIVTFYVNEDRFIPGERIFFRIENNLASGQRSFISKVAYVELIDAAHQSILKSKVKLDHGIGKGHLYLPSFLKTGHYTLIAYTAWMLNYPKPFIAQLGIQIINPFNPMPASFLSDSVGITFYPEGGAYVLNQNTRVAYRLSLKKPSRRLNIKVLDPSGEEVSSFNHDHVSPFGHFNFTPTYNGTFKIVITDTNENIYYDQLSVENFSPIGLAVNEYESSYQVKLINQSGGPQLLRMISWHRPNYQKSFLINSDTTLSIQKKEWPKGLAYLFFEGTKIGRFISMTDVEVPKNPAALTNKAQYKTRELVNLQIPNVANITSLSVSVSKVYDQAFKRSYSSDLEHQLVDEKLNSQELQEDFLMSKSITGPLFFSDSIVTLPDYRGQLLYGQLQDMTSNMGELIILSSITQTPQIRTAKVNGNGQFLLLSPETYQRNNLVLFNTNQKSATVKERFLDDYSFVRVDHVFDRTEISSWIERKSVDVQIENNYYEFKKDLSTATLQANLFANRIDKTYDFDDYTRFPTITDVIVEIIPELRLRERNGRIELMMPYIENKSSAIDSVLILVDGIPVKTNEFIKLNPVQLKRVDLVFEQLKLGYAEYRGVAMFSSISKDGSLLKDLAGYSNIEILPLQDKVKYYQPNYDLIQFTMPDHRSQLLWDPDFDLSKGDTFEFYTSDLTGTFEIVMQGHNRAGNYMISKSTFEVVK